MPIYGQATEFNERLCSLMSCIFCNSNDLYDGGLTHLTKNIQSSTPTHLSSLRPLFTEAILRKSSRLKEIRWKPKSSPTTPIVLQVILVSSPEDSSICNLLANLISHLFIMPEEHSSDLVLELVSVRSNSIRWVDFLQHFYMTFDNFCQVCTSYTSPHSMWNICVISWTRVATPRIVIHDIESYFSRNRIQIILPNMSFNLKERI